jgi:hypothetical protein
VGDAHEDPSVVGQEAPRLHRTVNPSGPILEIHC